MRLFSYYALHSFVNQLRKLFKTWVLVFFLACLVIGGLIGVGVAMLEDTMEANQPPAAITEELSESEAQEKTAALPISATAIVELAAGGVILALFFFEAVSADKNGSRIFLPADVNLLFPSPMKPQSVLMFRLATQLGTALLATIYILFQLPNLVFNAGLSGWTALAILVVWFSSILVGKLLQVLLYTVCASNPRVKGCLRKGIYALVIVLLGGFFLFWKASGDALLPAADRFFNAPFTRWIPFWGWLKGLTVFISETNWLLAAVSFGLLAAGCAVLVWFIWNINADFYEDAMAKSEEIAALMEKARSEKTSGTAVTRQRKKDRAESLRRDGMQHGWGASVFFHKTLYNRFRFSHFGFLTKTMETYFVAALGTAAAMRWFFGNPTELPVVLTLGVLVFFRAMGNPLAEDTGMDFFRLIPESTWQKLFFSLLGGTVCCLMDLVLPMLAASALLMVNPLKLFLWLPLIVSVDFYASSVVTFIDLSVPASIGKTIKSLITIFFIYFGLLPDIGILTFGIVTGHTATAAMGSTIVNLLLGILAFSLATVFLQPKGKDYVQAAENLDLTAAKRQFSRIGFSILAILALTTVFQIVLLASFPDVLNGEWGIWLVTFIPQYVIAMPIGILMLKKIPASTLHQTKLGISRGVKFAFVCVFMMYAGNLIGSLVTTVAGLISSTEVINPLDSYVTGDNLFARILAMVILAPLFEELIFRKMLIDRMHTYGGKTAVVLSALLFGLFHGNFSQFFYAFGLGLVFGYIYLNTGKLRYPIIAHMVINFMGSVFAPELMKRVSEQTVEEMLSQPASPWTMVAGGYSLFLIVGSLTGLVLLCMNAMNLHFTAGEQELPKGKRFRISCLNTGMLLVILACTVLTVYSLAAA